MLATLSIYFMHAYMPAVARWCLADIMQQVTFDIQILAQCTAVAGRNIRYLQVFGYNIALYYSVYWTHWNVDDMLSVDEHHIMKVTI